MKESFEGGALVAEVTIKKLIKTTDYSYIWSVEVDRVFKGPEVEEIIVTENIWPSTQDREPYWKVGEQQLLFLYEEEYSTKYSTGLCDQYSHALTEPYTKEERKVLGIDPTYAPFTDVPLSHTHADAISYVKEEGIVSGYPDGTFRAESTINRAEFAKIASQVYWEGEIDSINMCDSVHFDDVPRGTWFFHFVCSAKDHEIISGYPGTRIYAPEKSITVAEAAKMIVKAFTLQSTETDIETLSQHAALPVSLPALDQPITRGQVAEMFYRIKTNNYSKPSL